jgi:hypothetical protein
MSFSVSSSFTSLVIWRVLLLYGFFNTESVALDMLCNGLSTYLIDGGNWVAERRGGRTALTSIEKKQSFTLTSLVMMILMMMMTMVMTTTYE